MAAGISIHMSLIIAPSNPLATASFGTSLLETCCYGITSLPPTRTECIWKGYGRTRENERERERMREGVANWRPDLLLQAMLKGKLLREVDDNFTLMQDIGTQVLLSGRYASVADFAKAIDEVTPAQVSNLLTVQIEALQLCRSIDSAASCRKLCQETNTSAAQTLWHMETESLWSWASS